MREIEFICNADGTKCSFGAQCWTFEQTRTVERKLLNMFTLLLFIIPLAYAQTIKQLNEISINEELPIGSVVTFLTDKIPNLDQSLEYDLVAPASSDLDLFAIDHARHSLITKKRLDFEKLCPKSSTTRCILPISIAVSNQDTIYVYNLPIHLNNINDNPMKFPVNRTVIEIDENDSNWSQRAYSLPQASDADGDSISYSLYLQNWNKPNGLFALDRTNFSLNPLRAFDREEQNLYLLRLVAHNKHDKDVSLDIIVIIKDLNDNPPACDQHPAVFYINNTNSTAVFATNVTDPDEDDNGRLEYDLVNPLAGFSIDHNTGKIQFDYTQWTRSEQTNLFVNVTDHGKPSRLSTQCIVQLKFLFLYDVTFISNASQGDLIEIANLNAPIGRFVVMDKPNLQPCRDCSIRLTSSLADLFSLDDQTLDLSLNLDSLVLIRILSNYLIRSENLSVEIHLEVSDRTNPSIISTQNHAWRMHFNKEQLLINSNMLFIKVHEETAVDERIPMLNRFYSCLNEPSKELRLTDPTNTFAIDEQHHLVVKKALNVMAQQNYQVMLNALSENQTEQVTSCSIQLRLHIYNPYSIINVSPYFSQSFYILSSTNISQFTLPILPSHTKYISSKSHEISIDETNRSLTVLSPSLFSTYSYDFHIQVINSQTPSLSCAIPIRILFGMNHQAPRFMNNLTKLSIEIASSDLLYQIKAYDPDLSSDDQSGLVPPAIEYEIESSADLEIERYTGRIFRRNAKLSMYNFTVILTDFGQPNRLSRRERMILYLKSDETSRRQEVPIIVSTTFIFISAGIVLMVILLIVIILLLNCCHRRSSAKKSLANISPTTPDTRLIDNEYITTATSLPRVIHREQRIYPTVANNNERKLLEQIQLPPPPPELYTAEKVFVKPDYQHNLSMNDINKYLERFEKIYNNSTESQCQEPVGSVV